MAAEHSSKGSPDPLDLYRLGFERSAMGMVFASREGRIIDTNDAMCRFLGRRREELVGMSVAEISHPDERSTDGPLFQRLLAGQVQSVTRDKRYLRLDGSVVWGRMLGTLLRDDDGAALAIFAVIHDITASRRVAEEHRQAKLRAREEAEKRAASLARYNAIIAELTRSPALLAGDLEVFFRELTRAMSHASDTERVGIWYCEDEPEAHLRLVCSYQRDSDSHEAGTTLPATSFPRYFDALRTRRFIVADDARTHPDTSEFRDSYLAPHGITSMLDVPVILGDELRGAICLEQVGPARVWTQDEQSFAAAAAYLCTLAVESSRRARIRRALQASEQRLELAIRGARLAMWNWDLRTDMVKHSWPDWLGHDDGSVSTAVDAIDELVHPDESERIMQRLEAHLAGDTDAFDEELRILTAWGEWRWIRSCGRVVEREPDGTPLRVAGIHADITERRAAQEQLRELADELEHRVAERTAELEEAYRELESFNYSVSHDLRTPLRAMGGFATVLREDYSAQLDAKANSYLARISAGAERMGHLIDDLLDLARVSRYEMRCRDLDLSGLTRSVLADLQFREPDREVVLDIEEGMRVRADPGLIRVMMENLLENAWRFTRDRAPAEFRMSAERRDGRLRICLRDNGIGFDMRYVDKIFQPFQRLHGEEHLEGTGIGLATVARIIARHSGVIRAEGVVDGGATFWFELAAATDE